MKTPAFLEEQCPVEEISVEAQRERSANSALPPIYYLHVWWARRPLTVSRLSILGSLLGSEIDPLEFKEFLGIPRNADPAAASQKIREVKAGIRKDRVKDPYGYPRAFSHNPSPKQRERLADLFKARWGTSQPVVLDPFAGGGSIPLEALRLGLPGWANELNPVASAIERATIEYPAIFGSEIAKEIDEWGARIATAVETQTADCFPHKQGEKDLCYIWVRTVPCPRCELPIPLSPNWRLNRDGTVGFRLILPTSEKGSCTFKIEKKSSQFDPDSGTIASGTASCPRCKSVVEGEEIRVHARAGRLGEQLAIVGFKVEGQAERKFREVTPEDLQGVDRANVLLTKNWDRWESAGLIPNEPIPEGNKTRELLSMGILRWSDLFSRRQLLVHLTMLDAMLSQPWGDIKDPKRREALRVYLALALDKACDYNSIQCILRTSRLLIVHTFDRHDFAFSWSFAEIEGSGQLQRWAISQISKSTRELCKLIARGAAPVRAILGDAAHLRHVKDKSVAVVVTDPPYYDNVMYAELADFFYVWQKRALGAVLPDLYSAELTNKDAEAVANPARFRAPGRKNARDLADADYTAKMLAAFREAHRVLQDDGVLTLMFTHKRVEAWDSLARALLDAGFRISATWPVHTESEYSLHQAKKNAAASTILLVCRKRAPSSETVWWEDIQDDVKRNVREKAARFAEFGLKGQDVSIACFGPALQVISTRWPVKRKDGSTISPDDALDLARTEVGEWMFERIAEGKVQAVDKWTRFYILSWYVFGAREFPYDEARKLALSVKVDLDKEVISHGLLEKKGSSVRLSKPEERFRRGKLDATAKSYPWDIDYVHAAIQAYAHGQSTELARFHGRAEALKRDGYLNAIRYLIDGVLPRTAEVTEYYALDKLWEANLQDKVKRNRPRTTDPTFEKQRRLGQFDEEKSTKAPLKEPDPGPSEGNSEADEDPAVDKESDD